MLLLEFSSFLLLLLLVVCDFHNVLVQAQLLQGSSNLLDHVQQEQQQTNDTLAIVENTLAIDNSLYVVSFIKLDDDDYNLLGDALHILAERILQVNEVVLQQQENVVTYVNASMRLIKATDNCSYRNTTGDDDDSAHCEHALYQYELDIGSIADTDTKHRILETFAISTKIAIRDGTLQSILDTFDTENPMTVEEAEGMPLHSPFSNTENNNDDVSKQTSNADKNFFQRHMWLLIICAAVACLVIVISMRVVYRMYYPSKVMENDDDDVMKMIEPRKGGSDCTATHTDMDMSLPTIMEDLATDSYHTRGGLSDHGGKTEY